MRQQGQVGMEKEEVDDINLLLDIHTRKNSLRLFCRTSLEQQTDMENVGFGGRHDEVLVVTDLRF